MASQSSFVRSEDHSYSHKISIKATSRISERQRVLARPGLPLVWFDNSFIKKLVLTSASAAVPKMPLDVDVGGVASPMLIGACEKR